MNAEVKMESWSDREGEPTRVDMRKSGGGANSGGGCILGDADSYGFKFFEMAKEPHLTRSVTWNYCLICSLICCLLQIKEATCIALYDITIFHRAQENGAFMFIISKILASNIDKLFPNIPFLLLLIINWARTRGYGCAEPTCSPVLDGMPKPS